MQAFLAFLLLFCISLASSNKLTVYVQEAVPVPFTDEDILSQFTYVIAKSPHSDIYKLAVIKNGLNMPEVRTDPSYKVIADILAADGDKVGLWVNPRTFYNEAFLDIELPAGDKVVGSYSLIDGVAPALNDPKVLILSDQEHFERYMFGELKEVGHYEITPEEIKAVKQ